METENEVEYVVDRVCRIVPASGKIYDITHADTNEHSVALPTGYPANTKILIVRQTRIAGTGGIKIFSVTGDNIGGVLSEGNIGVWVRSADGTWLYKLTIANDDFDVYALGYITG